MRSQSRKFAWTMHSFSAIIFAIILVVEINSFPSAAQVISHALRRLAISTNQFGIDALRALDKIESPSKVLVFCPVCLSSSLSMIMMGSSKYPVVSALRQALYVWSMKPQELNRGFKDIFEHIGFNQQQQQLTNHSGLVTPLAGVRSLKFVDRSFEMENTPEIHQDGFKLSLPKLMRIKEIVDRSERDRQAHSATSSHRSYQGSGSGADSKARDPLRGPNSSQLLMMDDKMMKDFDTSQMSATSNIYMQRGLFINYNYNLLLRQHYKTVVHPVDFIRNAEETRQHINSIVASNTEGKVKDLVKKDSLGPAKLPKIMIISTFHFRGTLDLQMKTKEMTEKRGLGTSSSSSSTKNSSLATPEPNRPHSTKNPSFIETEETLLKFGNFANLDCCVVEIPFNSRLVSLVIVMANHLNSTDLLLTKLSARVLTDMMNSLTVKRLSVEIPVIKFDRGPINVEGLLRELGLHEIFFHNMVYSSETGINRWMRPSDIVHETSIDIGTINPKWSQTEDRLKIGAHDSRASALFGKAASAMGGERLRLDKPFFYFVVDSINGLVLTMGRVRQ